MMELTKLVNHEAWIECLEKGRAYFKWGHYPEIDGRFDPRSITRAFVVHPDGKERELTIGTDKTASSEGGLFLEFEANYEGIYTIGVEYDRGIYTVTEDGKWIFGEKRYVAKRYNAVESRWICGFAKAYFISGDEGSVKANFEFEIVPESMKKFRDGEKLRVQLLFRENPFKGNVNLRTKSGLLTVETDDDGFAEITLSKGVNVISAKYVDENVKICDKRNLTTTLTIIAEP